MCVEEQTHTKWNPQHLHTKKGSALSRPNHYLLIPPPPPVLLLLSVKGVPSLHRCLEPRGLWESDLIGPGPLLLPCSTDVGLTFHQDKKKRKSKGMGHIMNMLWIFIRFTRYFCCLMVCLESSAKTTYRKKQHKHNRKGAVV